MSPTSKSKRRARPQWEDTAPADAYFPVKTVWCQNGTTITMDYCREEIIVETDSSFETDALSRPGSVSVNLRMPDEFLMGMYDGRYEFPRGKKLDSFFEMIRKMVDDQHKMDVEDVLERTWRLERSAVVKSALDVEKL